MKEYKYTSKGRFDLRKLIGLAYYEAAEDIKGNGLVLRITRKDSEKFNVLTDCQMNRINVEIDNGKITKAYVG